MPGAAVTFAPHENLGLAKKVALVGFTGPGAENFYACLHSRSVGSRQEAHRESTASCFLPTGSSSDVARVQAARDGGVVGAANDAACIAEDGDVVIVNAKAQQEIVI